MFGEVNAGREVDRDKLFMESRELRRAIGHGIVAHYAPNRPVGSSS